MKANTLDGRKERRYRYMIKKKSRNDMRKRRHKRLRMKIKGTKSIPRLCVYRSLKHVYAQIIDDDEGKTLVSASTLEPSIRTSLAKTWDKVAAGKVGEIIAKKAISTGITRVVFDRGGYKYHGRVATLASKARENGLKF